MGSFFLSFSFPSYLVDSKDLRSPDLFVVILDFLRSGTVRLRGFAEHEVASEALFYGIEIPRSQKTEGSVKEYASIEAVRSSEYVSGNISSIFPLSGFREETVEKSINGVAITRARTWERANFHIQQAQKEGWKVESIEIEAGRYCWFLSRSIAEE